MIEENELEREPTLIEGQYGIKLVHRCYGCTVCNEEHGIWIPADNIAGYGAAIGRLMRQGICPGGAHETCCVSDDCGNECGDPAWNLEDYAWIADEVYPVFICEKHQGYFSRLDAENPASQGSGSDACNTGENPRD